MDSSLNPTTVITRDCSPKTVAMLSRCCPMMLRPSSSFVSGFGQGRPSRVPMPAARIATWIVIATPFVNSPYCDVYPPAMPAPVAQVSVLPSQRKRKGGRRWHPLLWSSGATIPGCWTTFRCRRCCMPRIRTLFRGCSQTSMVTWCCWPTTSAARAATPLTMSASRDGPPCWWGPAGPRRSGLPAAWWSRPARHRRRCWTARTAPPGCCRSPPPTGRRWTAPWPSCPPGRRDRCGSNCSACW